MMENAIAVSCRRTEVEFFLSAFTAEGAPLGMGSSSGNVNCFVSEFLDKGGDVH